MDRIWTETLERIACLEGLVDKLAARLARIEELAREPLAEMESKAKSEPESSPEIQDHINSVTKPESEQPGPKFQQPNDDPRQYGGETLPSKEDVENEQV